MSVHISTANGQVTQTQDPATIQESRCILPFNTEKYTESPYLKGSDLEEGERLTVTIKSAEEATFPQSGDTVPILGFLELEKQLTLNRTRITKLVELFGPDTEDWLGKKISLYPVDVNYQGKITQGVAIAAPPKKSKGGQQPEVEFERPAKKKQEDDDEENPF